MRLGFYFKRLLRSEDSSSLPDAKDVNTSIVNYSINYNYNSEYTDRNKLH